MKRIENVFFREIISEFLGTFVLILFGDSVLAVIIVGNQEHNAGLIGPLGWGVAIMCAVYIAGGVSAHLNPAVTLALVSVKKFPIKKVPLFFVAQYSGAFLGAVIVFAVYRDAINAFDNGVRSVVGPSGTALIFATYPREGISTLTCFIDQVIAAGCLMLTAEAITDERNLGGTPKPFIPLMLGLMIASEVFAFGSNCMAPLNPARDLGPRVFTAIAGWGGAVFSYRNFNWVWVPIFGPHIGTIIGAWIYKLCIESHWPPEEVTSLPQAISGTAEQHIEPPSPLGAVLASPHTVAQEKKHYDSAKHKSKHTSETPSPRRQSSKIAYPNQQVVPIQQPLVPIQQPLVPTQQQLGP